VAERFWPAPVISLQSLASRIERAVGKFRVAVEPSPLRVTVRTAEGLYDVFVLDGSSPTDAIGDFAFTIRARK
jgi:hypothetical protein